MTLTEFLLARIAEDEAVAVDCKILVPMGYSWRTISWLHGANREHGKRWDPARVLAECEAKRRIVTHAQIWETTLHRTPGGWTEATATAYRMAMEWTVRQLGEVYADHPDYREEWRP